MKHPDYDCSTVVVECMGDVLWQHRVISKDRLKAVTIAYSTSAKRTSPPVYHFHEPNAIDGESYDDCDVVQAPCTAELDLLIDIFDVGTMNKLHSGVIDPGVQFWRMMISRLASYIRGPVSYDYQDREESSCSEVCEPGLCDSSYQEIELVESGAEGLAGGSARDIQPDTRPSGRDGGHREGTGESLSGTTKRYDIN